MRASTFEDYLKFHDHCPVPHQDEPFMGLEPDGFYGETGFPDTFPISRDEDDWYEPSRTAATREDPVR